MALTIGLMSVTTQVKANPLVKPADNPTIETGQASWYGLRHNGRRTSSGETFDDRALTAAHPSLPLGSQVRVTSARTGASVIVTINDRQPPHGLRVIDLSRAAAARIGMLGSGIAMVTLSRVSPEELAAQANATANAGAPEEVAEAPGDGFSTSAARRGRRHTRHAVRSASAARMCCRAPSAVPARHSVPHRAAQHKL